jgi:glycine/D-amino acid oxidase-like deaminating enzyme
VQRYGPGVSRLRSPTHEPVSTGRHSDQPISSPWIAQLAADGAPRPLGTDLSTDILVVGAGIAGIATSFFTLRDTSLRVLLVERDRVGRGATGRNAGQLTTYFERPLCDIADAFGVEMAAEAQRGFDDAHDLLDLMVAEAGATVRVERFVGHMGMFNLQHALVHLRCNRVRQRGNLQIEACVVSEEAEFVDEIPAEYADLYTVVPQARVRALLETTDDSYRAVLSDRKGCINSGLLVQQVLAFLESRFPDRFAYHDHTDVEGITVDANGVRARAGGQTVTAARAVLCTNGFVDHVVTTPAGEPIRLEADQDITGRVAYMTAFVEDEPRTPAAMSYIRNTAIGGDNAYAYVTRRTYDRKDGDVTLTCMGGPEYPFHQPVYDPHAPFPAKLLAAMDDEVRPLAQPARPPGLPYDFHWHGLMGYNDGGIRVIGAHPQYPRLFYNLGCNGVGFLPSIYGGQRVARLVNGQPVPVSIFDPR